MFSYFLLNHNYFVTMQDYRTYLDFVLAMENKRESQSLQYFFRLLDIDGKGALTSFTIKYFFRVSQCLLMHCI